MKNSQNHSSKPILSIDLGTRYTKAYVYKDDKHTIIKSSLEKELIPTAVGLDQDEKIIYGSDAEAFSKHTPQNVVTELPLFVAAPYQTVSHLTKVKTKMDTLKRTIFQIKDKEYDTVDLLALFISGIVQTAQHSFPKDTFESIIVAVPNWWTPAHREVLNYALQILEFKTIYIVSNIICQCYDMHKNLISSPFEKKVNTGIIIDCGERELQVTKVEVNGDAITPVKYIHSPCGGAGMTSLLAHYLTTLFTEKDDEQFNDFVNSLQEDRKNVLFRYEVEALKEKFYPGSELEFSPLSLTQTLTIKEHIKCNEVVNNCPLNFYDGNSQRTETISEYITNGIKKSLDEIIQEESDQQPVFFETEGGFACSPFFRDHIQKLENMKISITQRVHPFQSIAHGAAYLLSDIIENSDKKLIQPTDSTRGYFLAFRYLGAQQQIQIPVKDSKFEFQPIKDCQIFFISKESSNSDFYDAIDDNKEAIERETRLFRTALVFQTQIASAKQKPRMIRNDNSDDDDQNEIQLISDDQTELIVPLLPQTPSIMPSILIHLKQNFEPDTKITGSFDISTGTITIDPMDSIQIKNQYGLEEAQIEQKKVKYNDLKNIEHKRNKLIALKNEFQGFFLNLKISHKRKKLPEFTEDMYGKVIKLSNKCEDWYNKNSDADYETMNNKLKEFRQEFDNIKFEIVINDTEELKTRAQNITLPDPPEMSNCIDDELQDFINQYSKLVQDIEKLISSIEGYNATKDYTEGTKKILKELENSITDKIGKCQDFLDKRKEKKESSKGQKPLASLIQSSGKPQNPSAEDFFKIKSKTKPKSYQNPKVAANEPANRKEVKENPKEEKEIAKVKKVITKEDAYKTLARTEFPEKYSLWPNEK